MLSQTITTLQNDSLSSTVAPIFQTTPLSQSQKCRKLLTQRKLKFKYSYIFCQFLNLKCTRDTKEKFKNSTTHWQAKCVKPKAHESTIRKKNEQIDETKVTIQQMRLHVENLVPLPTSIKINLLQ